MRVVKEGQTVVLSFGRRRGDSADPALVAESLNAEVPVLDAVLLGCHGGAGTSTMRVLLGAPWVLGRYAPMMRAIETFGRPLILVSRDSAPASARAGEAVTGITGAGGAIACLIVVADGSGPEPKEATVRMRLLENRVGRIVRFPFVAGLRYADTEDAGRVELPKKAERALAEIRESCAAAIPGTPAV